jgi:hypothetical protein
LLVSVTTLAFQGYAIATAAVSSSAAPSAAAPSAKDQKSCTGGIEANDVERVVADPQTATLALVEGLKASRSTAVDRSGRTEAGADRD